MGILAGTTLPHASPVCATRHTESRTAIGARLFELLVFLVASLPFAITVSQRGYYSDDYSLRRLVLEHDWLRVYPEYFQIWGGFRPLGAISILLNLGVLWNAPELMHMIFSLAWGAAGVLLFRVIRRWSDSDVCALLGTACFLCWPTTTTAVCWPTAASEMLPALLLFLTAIYLQLGIYRSNGALVRVRGTSIWVYGLYTLSILFHDQHLGAAVVFSIMAYFRAGCGRRWNALLGTWPFYAISLLVGLTSVITSSGSIRPLSPGGSNLFANSLSVLGSFMQMLVSTPATHWISGTGFREGLIEWSEADLPGLIVSWCLAASLLGSVAIASQYGARARRAKEIILAGLGLLLASLLIMAARPDGAISERHTLWPSLGVALMVGGWAAVASRPWVMRLTLLGAIPAMGLLLVVKTGHVYEWTIRTSATNAILQDVARMEPPLASGELLIIDNVRRLGRGFADSWGLTDAVSMSQGIEVRVATSVRVDDDQCYANASWDRPWLIDESSTRFLTWNHRSATLTPMSPNEFLVSHPDFAVCANPRPPLQVTLTKTRERGSP